MEKLLTRKEAARLLGISITTLNAARLNGQVYFVQYVENGCVYFTEQGLQEYTARATHRAKPKEKFEVDVNPPAFATFEHKYRLLPVPYEVRLYDMLSLFAGKTHAVICRARKSRIKGRDLYDYIFYLSKGAAVNQKHLRERLIDSGYISSDADCSLEEIKKILGERFDSIDFAQARKDVEPFIHDTSVLDIWSSDFFRQITNGLKAV